MELGVVWVTLKCMFPSVCSHLASIGPKVHLILTKNLKSITKGFLPAI